jgi:hypothetical protein
MYELLAVRFLKMFRWKLLRRLPLSNFHRANTSRHICKPYIFIYLRFKGTKLYKLSLLICRPKPLFVTPCLPSLFTGLRPFSACCELLINFSLGLFFDPENGGDMLLRNISWFLPDYTASFQRIEFFMDMLSSGVGSVRNSSYGQSSDKVISL